MDITKLINAPYKAGFITEIATEQIPRGLNEEVIKFISHKKNEPAFMLEFRLRAFKHWLSMSEPTWAKLNYPKIDYQDIIYYSAPKNLKKVNSLAEIDPKLLATYEKLGVPLHERAALAGVAIDAVFDSVSIATTFQEKLKSYGIIFCSISEAIQNYPDLIKKYLGKVVSYKDNFFACLNAAVFSDGTFCYIPQGIRCPMELSTYFRINALATGQFERTLIIAEDKSYVSYLEGCSAPIRKENQLHAAVVELIALHEAEIKYATVQNWYPGDENGVGGIYNFVTKRGLCLGDHAKIAWTQIETGSAITWKYPSVILRGNHSKGEFYSIAITNHHQQADTGTKMMHFGHNTSSVIISKGISAGKGRNTYRGKVYVAPTATNSHNYTTCDSLLLTDTCSANTFPSLEIKHNSAKIEHEATTSKISADQLFYCLQRGIDQEDAIAMIVNGFCKQILKKLPLEFAIEAQKLLEVSLEGSIG